MSAFDLCFKNTHDIVKGLLKTERVLNWDILSYFDHFKVENVVDHVKEHGQTYFHGLQVLQSSLIVFLILHEVYEHQGSLKWSLKLMGHHSCVRLDVVLLILLFKTFIDNS